MNGTPSTSATDRLLNALMDFLGQGPSNWVLAAIVAVVLLVLVWFLVPAVYRRVEYGKEKGKQDAAPPKSEAPLLAEPPVLQLSLNANHLALLPASAREILMAAAARDVERITAILNRDSDTHLFTEQAVRTFLDTLGEQSIPREEVPTKLAEIANAHLRLLDDLAHVRSSTPEAQKLREQAEAAAQAGRHAEVDALLQQVRDAELNGLEHLQTVLDERKRNAARAEFDRATNAQTQLDHATAAQCYEAAAALLPTTNQRSRMLLLDRAAEEWLVMGRVAAVENLYEQIRGLAETLAEECNSGEAQRDLWLALHKFADLRLRLGDFNCATTVLDRQLSIAEALAYASPTDAQAQRDLSVSLNQIAELRVRQGDINDAATALVRSLRIREVLAEADPTNAQAQRDLSVSLNRIAELRVRQGNINDASTALGRSLRIREALAEADPTDARAQRDLSVGLERIADLSLRQGNLAGATTALDRALHIDEALADADPTNAVAQRDLSVSLYRIADLRMRQGNLDSAASALDRALSIAEALADANPTDAQAQRDLSASLNQNADLRLRQNDLNGAASALARSLRISEALADATNAETQRDLLVCLNKVADLRLRQGDLDGSTSVLDRALRICEALAGTNTNDVQAQEDLAYVHAKLAGLGMRDAPTHAHAVLSIVEPLLAAGKHGEYLEELSELAIAVLSDASEPN